MMPIQINAIDAISYLQLFLTHNKARGMVAEIALNSELGQHKKLLSGGWLISPSGTDVYKYRFIVFVLPDLYASESEVDTAASVLELDRGWQTLATFLHQSSIGIVKVN